MAKYTMQELAKIQIELEKEMKSVGIAKYHENQARAEGKRDSNTQHYNAVVVYSVDQMEQTILAFMESYKGKRGKRPTFLAMLSMLDVKTSALVGLRSVIDLMCLKDMSITAMSYRVGQRIEDQFRFANVEKQAPYYIEAVQESLRKSATQSYSHARKSLLAAEKKLEKNNDIQAHKEWDKDLVSQLGSFIIDCVANINFEGEPLLSKEVTNDGKNNTFHLIPSPKLSAWIEKFTRFNQLQCPEFAPCVIKPKQWTAVDNGGYYVKSIAKTLPMVRGKKKYTENQDYESMPTVYNAINKLQSVGWKISENTMFVLEEIMSKKLELCIPSFEPIEVMQAPIPEELAELKGKDLWDALDDDGKKAFSQWKEDRVNAIQADKVRQVDLNAIGRLLNQAKRYNNFEEFYFVYSLDYRGRIYCASSVLTPQGNDIQKAMIQFAKGKELGFQGAYWLAVQGAGVWNIKDSNGIALDKKTFGERVRYVLTGEFSEMVKAIASDPLSNRQWANADKPWQFLTWCFEWDSFLEWCEEGNDPKQFVSHLPIAQDGTCSGTQHYAMMLRDENTAKAVNVGYVANPQDIYRDTSDLFVSLLSRQMEEADLGEQLILSEWIRLANRNLAKPPVMTKVYGAALMTCRKQMKDYLIEMQQKANAKARAEGKKAEAVHNFGDKKEEINAAVAIGSKYLWKAVNSVQSALDPAMKFIKKVAKDCADRNQTMRWTTPTGLKVVQDIREMESRSIETMLFGRTKLRIREETLEIDKPAMSAASAPNFIHSLDASHLTLVSDKFLNEENDYSLAVIHDSFGSHACDTARLRRTLNREMVGMYHTNWLVELANQNGYEYDEEDLPLQGNLNFTEVLQSRYMFG